MYMSDSTSLDSKKFELKKSFLNGLYPWIDNFSISFLCFCFFFYFPAPWYVKFSKRMPHTVRDFTRIWLVENAVMFWACFSCAQFVTPNNFINYCFLPERAVCRQQMRFILQLYQAPRLWALIFRLKRDIWFDQSRYFYALHLVFWTWFARLRIH